MRKANMIYKDIEGLIFGRLTILKELPRRFSGKENRSHRRVNCICLCGNEKEVRLDRLTGFETISCGCVQKEKAAEHLRSRGTGKTKNRLKVRKSKDYILWRNNCMIRDNYTCQISGVKGGRLVVHHLTPFSLLWNDVNGEIIYDKIAFDINNGITISEEVHDLFHKQYGLRKFTKEDFLEFKNNYNANK